MIKKYFLQKKVNDVSQERQAANTSQNVKSIGILTTKELDDVFDFEKEVKKIIPKYRSINSYRFRKFHKADEKSFHHFSEKDFNFLGSIKEESLQSFVDTPFDILLCYFDTQHVFLENITKQSTANLKIGFSNVNQSLFDLEILESIQNLDQFNAEVKKYLPILGKVDL